MLPFVRMLEYGNIKPVGDVKKISAGIRHLMVLRSNGDLYSTGLNTLGQGGMNNKGISTANKFNKTVLSGVKDVICGGYTSLAVMSDKRVLMCGRTAPLGNGYTATEIYEQWTDVSNLFSQFNLDTVKIYMASGFISVLDGSTLYSLGNYSTNSRAIGAGLTSLSRVFVQVATDVQKLFITDYPNLSFYLDSNRNVWGCGQNSYGSLGNATTTDIFPYTKLSNPVPINMIACNVQQGVTFFGDTRTYMTGSSYNGGLGDGIVANSYYSRFTNNPYIPPEMIGTNIRSTSVQTSPGTTLVAVGTTLWEAGYDFYGAGGTGGTGGSDPARIFYTKLAVQPNISDITITTTQYTSYVWNSTEIWASGDPESLPSTVGYFTFTKLKLPWE